MKNNKLMVLRFFPKLIAVLPTIRTLYLSKKLSLMFLNTETQSGKREIKT